MYSYIYIYIYIHTRRRDINVLCFPLASVTGTARKKLEMHQCIYWIWDLLDLLDILDIFTYGKHTCCKINQIDRENAKGRGTVKIETLVANPIRRPDFDKT